MLDSSCGAGVARRVIRNAWECGAVLVSKAVHGTAIDNQLPVDTCLVHFLNEPFRLLTFSCRNSDSLSRTISYGVPSLKRRVISAIRLPKRSAVSVSPMLGASSSALLCPIAPTQVPSRFRSERAPPLQLFPGRSPTPTRIMPSCIANTFSCNKVESLSPFREVELVNPTAILSFHRCSSQRGRKAASRNALNNRHSTHIYVAHPKNIPLPPLGSVLN